MSTKATIILTKENEHWYEDVSEPIKDNPRKYAITLEFSKKNIRVDINDDDDIVMTVTNPECEIYKLLSGLLFRTIHQGKTAINELSKNIGYSAYADKIKELYGLVATEEDRFIVKDTIDWSSKYMKMETGMSIRLIYNILSAGIKPKQIQKILNLLDYYKIEEKDYIDFIREILNTINSNQA